MLDDHFDRAPNGALIFTDHVDRIVAQLLAPLRVSEQFSKGLLERGGMRHLNRSSAIDKNAGDGGEVLHLWPEDHGLAHRAGFDGILPTLADQALADEDDGGLLVKIF